MADFSDDIQTYRQMLKLDRRSRVFSLLAEELCAAGRWEEAAEVCKKGLLFHPDHLRSRVLLGWALMEMGATGQSEGILLKAVEDIRKNSIIFKLLSEFATISGNIQSAAEYAEIYEALRINGARQSEIASPDVPVPPPAGESSELDKLKADAIEALKGEDPENASPEILTEPEAEAGLDRLSLDQVMDHLIQRIDGRVALAVSPAAIFSDKDRNMLKQKIVAALSA